MKLAAVDIGTNSVLLLIAQQETPGGELSAWKERCIITRLGQGLLPSKRLQPQAVERTLAALGRFARSMDEARVDFRGAIGTAVLREASNAGDFLVKAEAILGCPVEVVSGEREARLVLDGVQGRSDPLSGQTLLFDVGGGSTEVVLADDGALVTLASIPLGAVKLTESAGPGDPPSPDQVAAMQASAAQALASLPPLARPGLRVIGTGGTITTLMAIFLGMERYDSQRVEGQTLSSEEVRRQMKLFARLPLERRRAIPGLDPARADIILGGACIVDALLRHAGVQDLRVSDRGVRWGLLYQALA